MKTMKRFLAWVAMIAVLLSSFAYAEEAEYVEIHAPAETELLLAEEAPAEEADEAVEEIVEPTEEPPKEGAAAPADGEENEKEPEDGAEEHECWQSCLNPGVCGTCGIALGDDYGVGHNWYIESEDRDNWVDLGNGSHGLVCFDCNEAFEVWEHGQSCLNPGVCATCGVALGDDYGIGHNWYIESEDRDNWVDLGDGEHGLVCFDCGGTFEVWPHAMDCAGDQSVCMSCGAALVGEPYEDFDVGHEFWLEDEQRENWIVTDEGHARQCLKCHELFDEGEHGVSCTAEDKGVCSGCGIEIEDAEIWHNAWLEDEQRDNWVHTEEGWVLQCLDCGETWEQHECWVRCGNEGVCDQCGNPCDLEPQHDYWNREEERLNCYPMPDDPSMHYYVCDGCSETVETGMHGVNCDAADKGVCSDCGASVEGIEYEDWHPVPDWTPVVNPANPDEHGVYCPGCDQVVFCDPHWAMCSEPGRCADCGYEKAFAPDEIGGHDTWDEANQRYNCFYNGDDTHTVKCVHCGLVLQEAERCYAFCDDPAKDKCYACGQLMSNLDIWHADFGEDTDGEWVVNPENANECGLKCNRCGDMVAGPWIHFVSCTSEGKCVRCGAVAEDAEFGHNTWNDEEQRENCIPSTEDPNLHFYACVDCGEVVEVANHGVSCQAEDQSVCSGCGASVIGCEYDEWHNVWLEEEQRENWIVTESGKWAVQCLDCGATLGEHDCWVRCGNEGVCDECGNPCDLDPQHDYWNREEDRLNCYPMADDPSMHSYVCDGCGETVETGRHGVSCQAEDQSVCSDCGISIEGREYDEWHSFWIEEEQRDNWILTENGRWAVQCTECGKIEGEHDCWVRCGEEGFCAECGNPCDAQPEHEYWNLDENRLNCYVNPDNPEMHYILCFGCGEIVEEGRHGVSCQAEDQSVCSDCGAPVAGIEYEEWHNVWLEDEQRENWIVTESGNWAVQCLDCGAIVGEHDCWVRCGNEGVCDECGNPCDLEPQHDCWNHEEDRLNCYPMADDPSMHSYVCDGCGETVETGRHGVSCQAEDQTVCSDCGVSIEGREYDEWHNDWIDEEQRNNLKPNPENPATHISVCFDCGEAVWENEHWAPCTDSNHCADCGAECELPEGNISHFIWNEELGRANCYQNAEKPSVHDVICMDCGNVVVLEVHYVSCEDPDSGVCAACTAEWDAMPILGHPEIDSEGFCTNCGVNVWEDNDCEHVASCLNPSMCILCGRMVDSGNITHNIPEGAKATVVPGAPELCGYKCLDCGMIDCPAPHVALCDQADKSVCYACGTKVENLPIDHYANPSTHGCDADSHWYDCRKCGEHFEQPHQIFCNEYPYCMYGCGEVTSGYIIHTNGGVDWEATPTPPPTAETQPVLLCSTCGKYAGIEEHSYVNGLCACGAMEDNGCPHEYKVYKNLGGGMHSVTCETCGFDLPAEEHYRECWKTSPYCSGCQAYYDGDNRVCVGYASCINPGVCTTCGQYTDKISHVNTKEITDAYFHSTVCADCGELMYKSKHYVICDPSGEYYCSLKVGCGMKVDPDCVEIIHLPKGEAKVDPKNSDYHYFTCSECGKKISELHDVSCLYDGACTRCGYQPESGKQHYNADFTQAPVQIAGQPAMHGWYCECGEIAYALPHSFVDGLCVCGLEATGVTGITAPDKLTMAVGQKMQLGVLVEGTAVKFEYKTSSSKVAVIDESGMITAKKDGSAKITVTATGADGTAASATVSVTVKKAPTKVTLSDKKLDMGIGEQITLKATLSSGSYSALIWSTDNAAVATVDDNGVVTAVAGGVATIKVETFNGKTASCTVSVLEAPAELKVDVDSLDLIVKKNYTLKAEAVGATGGPCKGELSYASSDKSIATISSSGKITAKKAGSCTITVSTYNGLVKEIPLRVWKAPSKVSLDVKTATIGKGETLQLTASIAEDCYSSFTWSTSKKSVATVDANGLVSAVGEGKATITVKTDNGKKATVKVEVVDPYVVAGISFPQGKSTSIAVGELLLLVPEITPETAETTLSWKSSSTKVATVEDGMVLGVKAGSAKITVQTANGKKASITVKVVAEKKASSISSYVGSWDLDRASVQGVSIPTEGLIEGVEFVVKKDSIRLTFEDETSETAEWTFKDGALIIEEEEGTVACRLYGSKMLAMEVTSDVLGGTVTLWFTK